MSRCEEAAYAGTYLEDLFPVHYVGKVDQKTSWHTTQHGVIQVERTVRCGQYNHPLIIFCFQPIPHAHEFVLYLSHCLVFPCLLSATQNAGEERIVRRCNTYQSSYLSTSSINMTQGEILLASVNIALAYFSPSPNHLEPIADIEQSGQGSVESFRDEGVGHTQKIRARFSCNCLGQHGFPRPWRTKEQYTLARFPQVALPK